MTSIRTSARTRLAATLLSCAVLGALVTGTSSEAVTPSSGAAVAQGAVVSRSGPTPGTGQAPPVKEHVSGLPWSSGLTPVAVSAANAERFGRLRKARVDNIAVYPGRQSWETLLSTYWTQALPSYFEAARDDLVVALPMFPATNTLQDTGTDEEWRALGARIASVDPDAYVRLGWEMNIPGAWSLLKSNADVWIPAWRRSATLIKQGCPRCQLVWNANHGLDNPKNYPSRQAFLQLKDLISVYGIDDYDIYPAILDEESRRAHMDGPGQFNESYRFARKYGKRFAVPEWGIACNDKAAGCFWAPDAGGDNPRYVNILMRWFAARSRYIAFESYFDEPSSGSRSSLYTKPIGPRAGKAYRDEIVKIKRSYR